MSATAISTPKKLARQEIPDGATRTCVFDGVVEKIDKHTAKESFVGRNLQVGRGVHGERDSSGVRQGAHGASAFRDQFVEIELSRRKEMLAGVGAGQREEILDDFCEAGSFVV